MATLNVVLFQPQIPQNTGNIVRTCAATNTRLHLVGPMGFVMDNAKLKRAGLDYWQFMDITSYKSIDEFFQLNEGGHFYFYTSKGETIHSDATYEDGSFLIFGREDAGIDEQILFEHKDDCVRMPMQTGIRCLNLSNAVAIAVYEVLRQWDYPQLTTKGSLTKYNWDDAN